MPENSVEIVVEQYGPCKACGAEYTRNDHEYVGGHKDGCWFAALLAQGKWTNAEQA